MVEKDLVTAHLGILSLVTLVPQWHLNADEAPMLSWERLCASFWSVAAPCLQHLGLQCSIYSYCFLIFQAVLLKPLDIVFEPRSVAARRTPTTCASLWGAGWQRRSGLWFWGERFSKAGQPQTNLDDFVNIRNVCICQSYAYIPEFQTSETYHCKASQFASFKQSHFTYISSKTCSRWTCSAYYI